MKKLNFNIPFSGFSGTTFINCFASAYLFLEGIAGEEQENIFMLFDTMCGRSALRCRFDGEPTETTPECWRRLSGQ